MDILDIDEVLKDDSFCLMKENSQEDVANILKQWKQNSTKMPQGSKFDTRTFTRPKRRPAMNLDTTFENLTLKSERIPNLPNNQINMQIGGPVTNSMQRSLLNDVSPPSSICSSMDWSNDHMNNSLITSGDFTNVSFFKTTNDDEDLIGDAHFNGYNLDGVIKDRLFLENLTLSGDSTTIKDSNIAQIDEIQYPSQLNSHNSTMCNSVESTEGGGGGGGGGGGDEGGESGSGSSTLNETYRPLNSTIVDNNNSKRQLLDATFHKEMNKTTSNFNNITNGADDPIANTTFSLIESITEPLHSTDHNIMNLTIDKGPGDLCSTFTRKTKESVLNKTFDKGFGNRTMPIIGKEISDIPGTIITTKSPTEGTTNEDLDKDQNQIMDFINNKETEYNNLMNETYDNNAQDLDNLTFNSCGTPKTTNSICGGAESNSICDNKHNFLQSTPQQAKPFIKTVISENVNISPIVPIVKPLDKIDQDDDEFDDDIGSIERQIDLIDDPNKDIEHCIRDDYEKYEKDMLILASDGNEKDLDDLLENCNISAINAEAIRMRESLDYIKKRHSLVNLEKQRQDSSAFKKRSIRNDQTLDSNRFLNDSMEKSTTPSTLSSSGGSERLLNRRSRLYDNIVLPDNLSSKSSGEESNNKSPLVKDQPSQLNNENFENNIQQQQQINELDTDRANILDTPQLKDKSNTDKVRDRDRFKTIRIFRKFKDPSINVPCVDGSGDSENDENSLQQHSYTEQQHQQQQQQQPVPTIEQQKRFSRKDNNSPTLFVKNNAKTGFNNSFGQKEDILKKPLAHKIPNSDDHQKEGSIDRQRSLSRPKYASGIARNQAVYGEPLSKANSAGDLGKASNMAKRQSHFGYPNKMSSSKPSSQPSLLHHKGILGADNEKNTNSGRNVLSRPSPAKSVPENMEKNGTGTFKVPQPVANLRAPNSRRTGLVRPSSGFYSYNVTRNDSDTESGRYSPSDSLSSSASSKGSTNELPQKYYNGRLSDDTMINNVTNDINHIEQQPQQQSSSRSSSVARTTTIPKPSGLRPPSNIRKSGLPRPASTVIRR